MFFSLASFVFFHVWTGQLEKLRAILIKLSGLIPFRTGMTRFDFRFWMWTDPNHDNITVFFPQRRCALYRLPFPLIFMFVDYSKQVGFFGFCCKQTKFCSLLNVFRLMIDSRILRIRPEVFGAKPASCAVNRLRTSASSAAAAAGSVKSADVRRRVVYNCWLPLLTKRWFASFETVQRSYERQKHIQRRCYSEPSRMLTENMDFC